MDSQGQHPHMHSCVFEQVRRAYNCCTRRHPRHHVVVIAILCSRRFGIGIHTYLESAEILFDRTDDTTTIPLDHQMGFIHHPPPPKLVRSMPVLNYAKGST